MQGVAALAEQVGVVDEYDAVVHDDADEDEQPHGGEYVEGVASDEVNRHDPDEREGYREDDDEGVAERFKEARHDAEDEEDCHDADEGEAGHHSNHLRVLPFELDDHIILDGDFSPDERLHPALQRIDSCPRLCARRYVYDAALVFPVYGEGAGAFAVLNKT